MSSEYYKNFRNKFFLFLKQQREREKEKEIKVYLL